MSNLAGAPFPLPEKTRIKLIPSSPFSSLRLRKSLSGQKEKANKIGGDPEYEEIGPQRNNSKEIQNDKKNENSTHCDLCGSSDAEVRCEKCSCQAFCSACDETYHGHPKRANHTRKSMTGEVNHVRPPIPPKVPDGTVAVPTATTPPQPPPRRNKKVGILPSAFGSKDQNDNETGRSLMGSLKKIMGNRPLPAPPDQNLDKRRSSTPNIKSSSNITNSSPALNYDGDVQAITMALPQSIMEINNKAINRKPPSSMPPTPPSASQQYPKIQAKCPPVPGRKFSLQQFPSNFEDKRASLVDGNSAGNNSWDKQQQQQQQQLSGQQQQQQPQQPGPQKLRSQSVSDEQWNQMLVLHGSHPPQGFTGSTATSEVGGIALQRRPYNTMGGTMRPFGRGMVSSASVCDLNTLNQQQHQHQQQQQLHQPGAYPNIHTANSFQQLSVMSYDPNMVWVQPSACTLCQTPQMFPQAALGAGGMKRTTSNISMNLSSVGSDMTGYPWPHVHHHMPMGYPGYYPGCHPHMVPAGYTQGSAMSIPDSMKSYNRRPSSPAPSARSSSHRSHKSSKSRSFNVTDAGRRSRNHSRKRSEESEESESSSSLSDEHNLPITTKSSSKPGGLAWQCDHCTFINPGHVQSCGMCSKVPGKTTNGRISRRGNDRRKSDKRRDKKSDSGDNVHNVSDYDNDQKKDIRRDNRLKSSGSVKSSSGRSKKKSRRRDSSPSHSSSGSGSDDEDEEVQLETQLRDLRITSRSRAGEYDAYSGTSRTKEKERVSLKKEGGGGGSRYRNRRRYHSDRSMTPARSSPSRRSGKASINSDEKNSNDNKSSTNDLDEIIQQDNKSSHEGTLVGTTASESNTLKNSNSKEQSGSLKHWKGNQSLNTKRTSHSKKSESPESSELEDPFNSPPKEPDESHDEDDDKNIVEVQVEQEEPKENKINNDQTVIDKYQEEKCKFNQEKEYEQPDNKPYQAYLSPANAKGDVDEPSFANTLDGIETMGTNEVADYDPSQALEYKIEDSDQVLQALDALLPELNYIQRRTPENKVENNNEYDLYEKSDHEDENIKEEILYKKDNDNKEQMESPNKSKEEEVVKVNASHDPSYEVIDNPKETVSDIKESAEKKVELKSNEIIEQNKTNIIESAEEEDLDTESDNDPIDEEKDLPEPIKEKEDSVEDTLESMSSENSNEVFSPRRDRQHTPLSISSSDAQFYSPPNSPDISLNERLRGKHIPNERQVYEDEDSLEGEEEDEEEVTKPPSSVAINLPPEEEASQGYGNISFSDARTQPESVTLVRSTSEQGLAPKSHLPGEKNEYKKSPKLAKPKRNIEKEIIASEEEEEIDEKYLNVEELIKRRKQKAMKEQGLQLVQILREAEERGYNPEEVSVAITLCEKNKSPVEWLQENWRHMVDTVMTLASNYGIERSANDIGEISSTEAKKALRANKGNIWDAVTSCVEERQKKYDEIVSRGNFKREDIIKSLTDHEGDSEKAFLELSKTQHIGSFFSKIWGGLMESMPRVMIERAQQPTNIEAEKKEKMLPFQEPQKEVKESRKKRKSKKKKVTTTNNSGSESKDGQFQSKIYSDVRDPTHIYNQTDEETENEIYENFVNPLLEKLGDSLPKRGDGNPLISEELKRKIVQAILEGDNDPAQENVVFDSDEESTIEELLAVAENPTFYDYFTAVDLEDFEDISETHNEPERVINDNEASTSSYDSPGTLSDEEKEIKEYEEGPILTEGVQSDFEYFDEFKSVDNETTDEEREEEEEEEEDTDPDEELQFIREEDTKIQSLQSIDKIEATEQKNSVDIKVTTSSSTLVPSEVENIRSRSGPVTVLKATQIVGKAIAKAMARETSVHRDSISSESSSQGGSQTPASTPEPEEVADLAPLGSKLTQPRPASSENSGPVTIQNKPEVSAVAPRPEPAKSVSIPPAVASYSGPIFIPSSSSVAPKVSSDSNHHTYYNDPLNIENNSSQKDLSAHYETIRETQNAKPDNLHKDDIKPPSASVSSMQTPSNADRPLTTDKKSKLSAVKDDKEAIPSSSTKTSNNNKQLKTENFKERSLDKTSKQSTSKEENEGNKQAKIKNIINTPHSLRAASKTGKTGSLPDISATKDQNVSKPETDKEVNTASANVKKPPAAPKKKILKGKSSRGSSVESEEEKEKEEKEEEEEEEEEEARANLDMEKVENLKNRKGTEVDDQEVQELKEQIQMLRKELESKGDSDEDESNRSSTLKDKIESQARPVIVLQTPEGENDEPEGKEDEEEKTQILPEEDKQQYEQLKFDRTVRRLLAEGQATSYEKAELAAQLLNLSFDETDSIQAAEGCSSIYTALQFLQQECELCAEKYPMGKMVSMLQCVHRCCYDCANTYFSFQIKTKNIRELRCPFCEEPDLDASEEIAAEYLNNLDILLKNILDQETHELFQNKLRDWTLMKDPNFRWCNKCSSGFIANPRARKLICPDCKDVTCAQCRKQWEAQHTGITCEAFAQWKEENEPETQAESVAKHLAENGITCPSCRFTYSLAKGGCMHFTCTECKFEFCSGCGQPFRQGAKCLIGPYCERLGLHSHHPRNCLFYLRDKEPGQLQQLLQEHNIQYDTEAATDAENSKRVCRVQEQKETMEGLRDDICGRITQEGYAGLCRLHYIEYLVEKINNHGLDPVSIFDEADLRVCLRRNGKSVPVRRWESEKLYRDKLIKLIKEQLPLT